MPQEQGKCHNNISLVLSRLEGFSLPLKLKLKKWRHFLKSLRTDSFHVHQVFC